MKSIRPFNAESIPKPPQDLPWTDWPSGPVLIDIGCGAGESSLLLAQKHPQWTVLGIERTKNRFEVFEKARREAALSNLFALRADAVPWITHNVPPKSVDHYSLLYPNPYPKAEQANQRWHRSSFMERLLETLKDGGSLTIATNISTYIQEAHEYLVSYWGMELVSIRMLESTIEHRTPFERKYLERGEICWELICQKGGSERSHYYLKSTDLSPA
jgi:tRNA (guanine-N7-)-methyltransferase